LLIDYIVHFFRSDTRHGTHSPFVYALIDECIYRSAPRASSELQKHFGALKMDDELLEGYDYGQNKQTKRSVAYYAKRSMSQEVQTQLLYRLVDRFRPQKVLELGSNLGKSLCYMASANTDGKCTGVEGNQALSDHANRSIELLGLKNAAVVSSNFESFLENTQETFDLVFIDGNHHYDPTVEYFDKLKPMMAEQGIMIFHDIYHSSEMKRAWAHIKKDRSVSVSVDLFFMGLVFLGRPQSKEDFAIRFPKNLGQLLQ